MPKKRKTRQEKIILQLKRKLNKKFEPSQEANLIKLKPEPSKKLVSEKIASSAFFYDSNLIKKDLIKTFILALLVIGLEFVLYLKLR